MLDAGETLPEMPPWFHRENKWRAARYGLDARVIVDATGTQRHVREHLAETVSELAPIAVDLGCEAEFAGVSTILDGGASYERQLVVAESTDADLGEVVQHLIREFRSGPGAPVI
jgi:carboxylate-amine ligase